MSISSLRKNIGKSSPSSHVSWKLLLAILAMSHRDVDRPENILSLSLSRVLRKDRGSTKLRIAH